MATFKEPYTADEKHKFEAILTAFKPYIEDHYYFDVLYSRKCGYMYIIVNEDDVPVTILEDANELLYNLIFEISNDVRELKWHGPRMTTELFPDEVTETRRRVLPYFDSLEPKLKELCIAKMNEYLPECKS